MQFSHNFFSYTIPLVTLKFSFSKETKVTAFFLGQTAECRFKKGIVSIDCQLPVSVTLILRRSEDLLKFLLTKTRCKNTETENSFVWKVCRLSFGHIFNTETKIN